jgi:pyruvate/2-oxoglutarate dehydrogenase complex dihydrolipoamide acyltransferase (E2) component
MDVGETCQREAVPLVAPDLGVAEVAVSLWLVAEGAEVLEGDRVVELVAGGATVDLGAPVTGRLARQRVDEDEPVAAGAILAEFEATP